MIMQYKNKKNKKLFEAVTDTYATRIAAQFAQEERKRWTTLSKEEQDFCKLEKLYRNQDNPKFVIHFLKDHKPAIVLLSLQRDNNNSYRYCALNPYDKLFYKEPNKQFFDEDQEIIEYGKRYLKRALIQKKLKEKVDIECYATADSLVNTFVFGDLKDVSKALEEIDNDDDDDSDGNYSFGYILLDAMIVACGDCPRPKNETIELLLSKIQQKVNAGQWNIKDVPFVLNSRELLYSTAQNKELFSLIVNKDPYQCNRRIYEDGDQLTTNLEWMMQQKNHFDQEHIDIFLRDGSGMTVAEVQDMQHVERILNNQITDQEDYESMFWDKVITDVNDINNNKYLESLRIQGNF
ncbi:MAG TPA: hypothetical protein VKU36_03945 [Candidatus Babeliales bacterium]|nr:hypothetical protein [Candidatus Babeliales bacterium]